MLARNAGRLRAFVRQRAGNDADADDIAQEAQARVLARAQAAPLADPVAYAFRVALNLLHDHWRHAGPVMTDVADSHAPSLDASPLDALDMKQRMERYARALRDMPRLRREVFVLRHSDELAYAEIAERLKMSIEAAQKHYSRAASDIRQAVTLAREPQ